MPEEHFRLILKGYSKEKGEYYTEQDFAALLKIDVKKAKKLLKSAPVKLKEGLTEEMAAKYKKAMEKTGVVCEIETMRFDLSGLSLKPLDN